MGITRLLFIVFIGFSLPGHAQAVDSTRVVQHFSGSASITNNGISLVPSFSLGKPAVILLLSMGGERFSIDPDIRFGLNGKPWTFLFWARFKLFMEGRFRLNTGVHLGMNFRTTMLSNNRGVEEATVVRRYLAGELAPNYSIAKNISVGGYYLYSRGVDKGTVRNTHFITLNSNFSRIPISRQFFLRVTPQIFYLNQDGKRGYYATAMLTAAKNHFPLSVSFLVNKKLRSDIPGEDLISSLSLIYLFNRNYVPKAVVL